MRVWSTLEAAAGDEISAKKLVAIGEVVPEVWEVKSTRRLGIYLVEMETADLPGAERAIRLLSKSLPEVKVRKFTTRYVSED